MSGLLRRMRRGRAPADPAAEEAEPRAGDSAPPEHAPTEGGVPAVPAGTDLDELVGAPPDTRRRSKVRRRLRHLRRVREVLLRDLGGFVFELHRATGDQSQAETDLVAAKLERIGRVDGELRDLEAELDDRRPMVVREPGIGGACAVCGELFGSEARYCWACGTPVAPGAVRPVSAVAAAASNAAALGVPELAAGAQPQPSATPPPPPPPPIPHIEGTSEEMTLPSSAPEDPTAALRDTRSSGGPDDVTAAHERAAAPGTAGPDDATSQHDEAAVGERPVPPADVWDAEPGGEDFSWPPKGDKPVPPADVWAEGETPTSARAEADDTAPPAPSEADDTAPAAPSEADDAAPAAPSEADDTAPAAPSEADDIAPPAPSEADDIAPPAPSEDSASPSAALPADEAAAGPPAPPATPPAAGATHPAPPPEHPQERG